MQRFQQECVFLERIRHPNIVQYLGMTRDPESRLPVLLMELLDQSLTKMLEHSQRSLAYCVQVDICHDISLAVAYLHFNDIIHRDLSSNNVLIMAKSRAKVTDFGMSKLAGATPTMTPHTLCPGTVAYMPPEALKDPPVHTKNLDCFSEGVIMIQVCTRLWPEPGPRTRTVPFPASPTGVIEIPVPEPERRKKHIDMINRNHGLLPIAVDCLYYQENKRPSSEELCQRLAGLKETREYRESVEQVERVQNDITQLERQMREMQVREATSVRRETTAIQQLQELRDENQQLQHRYESEIQSKDLQLMQKDEQVQSQEREIQILYEQLEEQEHISEEIQQSLQRQMEQLQQQLSQQSDHEQITKPSQPPLSTCTAQLVRGRQLQQDHSVKEAQSQSFMQPSMQQKSDPPTRYLIELQWQDGSGIFIDDVGKAPYYMDRGAAIVDGNMAYFMNFDGHACSYDSTKQSWSKLPRCLHWYGGLAVIRGLLTAIGGVKLGTPVNKLLSMDSKAQVWVEHFPAMPSKRSHTAVVSTEEHLIVAGGKGDQSNPVEILDIQALVWSTAASLPHPYSWASATICEDQLYMLGGFDKDGTKSVLTCSLTKLLRSCSEISPSSVWQRIADVPVYRSTCAAVNGELLAVGGVDTKDKTTSAVHKYNRTTDSWDIISNMPTARYRCLVVVLPTNEVMVVGGYLESTPSSLFDELTDKIETADIIVI